AIGQVRTFFKTRNSVSRSEAVKFFIQLIKNIKPFIFKPKNIRDWEEQSGEIILQQLHAQMSREKLAQHGIVFPVTDFTMNVKFYWKDKYRRDNTNRLQSIEDIFVEKMIIADD